MVFAQCVWKHVVVARLLLSWLEEEVAIVPQLFFFLSPSVMRKKITLIALLIALFPWFFLGGSVKLHRVVQEVWELGHVVFFFLFALIGDDVLRHSISPRFRRYCYIYFLGFGLGAAIELIQLALPGRYFSYTDILHNCVGIITAFMGLIIKGEKSAKARFYWALVLLVLIIIVTLPIARIVMDELCSYKKFPVLSNFEARAEVGRWKGNNSSLERVRMVTQGGDYAMKLTLIPAKYSGANLKHFPGNWEGYRFLRLSAFIDSGGMTLHLRVHDKLHDKDQVYGNRFNGKVDLHSGWNEIRIPLSDIKNGPKAREMDMASIRGVGLFMIDLSEEHTIFLDNVMLE
ncbi:VanZ family protein [Desulfopila sp. IMCC35008]|uniref:VanZ family protein n=1 Tax=Desulfopila sp. IMCC35008 TaxID=2653858 RepID=UPI0013D47BF0|nr:VanZ family protein [Desulfopila sp. IMCC35008]